MKIFPSQYYFDKDTEERYIEWIFGKTRWFVAAVAGLVILLVLAITIANIYFSGYEIVSSTVLGVRLTVGLIAVATVVSFVWLDAFTSRKVLFTSTVILTFLAFLDTYFWVGRVGYFTPEAQMITIFMFMIVPFLNVEHKIVTGFLVIMGLVVCEYCYEADVFWSMLYVILMYAANIVIYFIFDVLLRNQYKSLCLEQDRSTLDVLTGLYNKNALYKYFSDDIKSLRLDEKMIVGVLDVDHFKDYNDTYGHIEGDKVLKQISQVLLSLGFDRVYRFGGEEFIFTAVKRGACMAKLPNICSIIEGLNIPHAKSKISPFVTASLGVITIRRENCIKKLTAESLLSRIIRKADANLYSAKSSGRNTIVDSGEPVVL